MFSKTSKAETSALNGPANKKGVPSVISSDLNILGNLVSEGLIDIDGNVEGNVKGEQVTVRANGRVSGDAIGEVVHVYGELRGLIRARAVHLYSSCHVEGVIMYQSLSVEDGAFVDGKFKRLQDNAPLEDSACSSSSIEDDFMEGSSALGNSLRLISS